MAVKYKTKAENRPSYTPKMPSGVKEGMAKPCYTKPDSPKMLPKPRYGKLM